MSLEKKLLSLVLISNHIGEWKPAEEGDLTI
jgi:hypothetical protein